MSLFARPKTNYGLDTPQTGGVGSGRGSRMFGRPPVPPTVYGRGMMSAEQQRRDHYQQSGGVPPVKMPTYGADGTPIYEPKFYEQMRRTNQAGSPAGAGYPPMPNAPEGVPANQPYAPMGGSYSPLANLMAQQTARQRMGIAPGGAAPPPVSPWGQVQQNPANTGIDPARIFRYPELAGVASSMDAYQGMAGQHDRMAASGALRDRNMGVFEQMGQPNRGLEAARGQADSIIGGASAARPRRLADGSYDTAPVLSPDAAAAQYGNSPLPGAPMVKPRFGQTLQEAQRDYMNIRNTVPGQTQARVNEMFDAGGQYQRGPTGASLPGFIGTSVGPSGQRLTVSQGPLRGGGQGPITITGQRSAQEWGGMASNLPGADGRTNAEMAKVRRENVAGARQDRRDASIIARAGQLGQRPTQNLGLFKSMQRQGMPMRGMPSKPGEQSGVTAPATVGEAVKTLQDFAQSPLGLQISESMGFDAANAKDRDWARVLSREDLVNLSEPDIRELQKASMAARAGGMGLNPGSGTLELMTAFETGGPSAALKVAKRQAVDSRHKTGPGYQYKPQAYGPRPATY